MPSKKKSKASASKNNPARGFATTSVASKQSQSEAAAAANVEATQIADTEGENDNQPKGQNGVSITKDATVASTEGGVKLAAPTSSNKATSEHEKQAVAYANLTPAEIEERLHTAELQSLVERYSAKSSRDAARLASRWATDLRVLRAAATPLASLPVDDAVLQKIVQAAKEDVASGVFSSNPYYSITSDYATSLGAVSDDVSSNTVPNGAAIGKLEKTRKIRLGEEDAICKLWTLQRALDALGFSHDSRDDVFKFLLKHSESIQTADQTAIWGLEEAIEWLVLNSTPDTSLPDYNSSTGRPVTQAPVKTDEESTLAIVGESQVKGKVRKDDFKTSQEAVIEETKEVEEKVSDLESDLEPDDLLSIHLDTRKRLYCIDPDVAMAAKKKPKTTSKLQRKLKQIESDALFDKREADFHWNNQRILLAREIAEEKRRTKQAPIAKAKILQNATDTDSTQSNEDDKSIEDGDDQEEDGGIGALFSSVSADDALTTSTVNDATNNEAIVIRDFGQSKGGLTARRVLEETCRARDPAVKVIYKLVSRTSFSNRHSVTVNWSKLQPDVSLSSFSLPSMETRTPNPTVNEFVMILVASPDAQQSEAYVSTVALFQLFSESSREEKSYLRLPPTWRKLWFELAEQKKEIVEAKERQTIEWLQGIYRACRGPDSGTNGEEEGDDEEDIVLTQNFKKRATTGQKGTETSSLRADDQAASGPLSAEQLKEIWTAKAVTASYNKMLQLRQKLPMYQFKSDAIAAVEQNQVTIICGETGCGKSTQMPSFILESELSQGRACKIYCTEPRRISAITLAQRVSDELGENSKRDLGTARSLVGYAIRLESNVVATTRLVYATTGIVLRMLESAAGFDEVTHIVIDEVHERSIETDFLLIILRALMRRRPELKIVLMSATVDASKFARYFNGAPVLNVPGRTFPVETKFLENAVEVTGYTVEGGTDEDLEDDEYLDEAAGTKGAKLQNPSAYLPKTRSTLSRMDEYKIDYNLIVKLISTIATHPQYAQYSKAILVFLPGIAEIRRLHDMLSGTNLGRRFIIHSLHSSIASEDQQRAFTIPPPDTCKIVISTNIAETGVTIPDVTCVIDSGKHKEMRFDERRQISRLIESFISRANAKQRRGRAGRVQEGLCFHLFTKARHDETMSDAQTPEMLRLSLQDLVMRVKICKLGDIQSTLAEALDPPSAKNIQRAIDSLIEVGALTSLQELTSLGVQLSKLPLDPYLGKLVLYGSLFGCLDVCLTVAAILSSKSPFLSSVGGSRTASDAARLSFQKGDSDLLTEYNAYTAWRRVCTTNSAPEFQFCKKSFLSVPGLCGIEDIKAQLIFSLAEAGFVKMSKEDRVAVSRIQNSASMNRHSRAFVPLTLMSSPFRLLSSGDETDKESQGESESERADFVIAAAFYPKLLQREGKGWRNVSNSSTIALHPTSIVRLGGSSSTTNNNGSTSEKMRRGVKYLAYYSIHASGGTKHPLASYLHPITPLPLILLAGSSHATVFHPLARVLSLDGAHLRFALHEVAAAGASHGSSNSNTLTRWHVYIALKYLRARIEELVSLSWKIPASYDDPYLSQDARGVRLRRWWSFLDDLINSLSPSASSSSMSSTLFS